MSTVPNELKQPITAEQVTQWLSITQRQRFDLHRQATEPGQRRQRQQAVLALFALLGEAIEEVRVMRTSLREGSQALRPYTAEIREHATQLLARPHLIPNTALDSIQTMGERIYLIGYGKRYFIEGAHANKQAMNQDELAAYLHSRAVPPCVLDAVFATLCQKGALALAKDDADQEWRITACLEYKRALLHTCVSPPRTLVPQEDGIFMTAILSLRPSSCTFTRPAGYPTPRF